MRISLRMHWMLSMAVVLLASGASFAQSAEDEAGDIAEVDKDALGPLRERVRPVSGHLFLKRGRFELSPSATLSIKDAFFTKYLFGGSLTYHLTETAAISLRGGYGLNVVSGAATICTNPDTGGLRTCRQATYNEVNGKAPGQIRLLAGLDGQWAPIYGKLSLVAEQFAHFDMYAIVGVAGVQYTGPNATATAAQDYMTVGGNVGVGARFFFNRFLTMRAEVRDLIYSERVVAAGSSKSNSLRNQILFELGFSVFLPTSFNEI